MDQTAALTIVYFFHLSATVIWVGGQVTTAWIFMPAARKQLDDKAYGVLLDQVVNRLQTIGWFCLAVLGVSGMFQMSANPNYQGFLAISNTWAAAILIKHLAIGLMVLMGGYFTWILAPNLRRVVLRLSKGVDDPVEVDRLRCQERALIRLNLIFSFVVLGLTALARSVS